MSIKSIKTILYIHHGKGLGGAPLSLLNLIKSLDRRFYTPIVLFLHDSEALTLFRQAGITVYGPALVYDFSHTAVWWFRLRHLHLLARAIKDSIKTIFHTASYWYDLLKPDIIHLNTSSLIGWAVVAHARKIPVVWHIREPLAAGYCGLRRAGITWAVRRYASVIIPICAYDARPWQQEKKVTIIYNPVDEHRFSPVLSQISRPRSSQISGLALSQSSRIQGNSDQSSFELLDTPQHSQTSLGGTILFLGGSSTAKGYDLLLEILFCLRQKRENFRCIIAGYYDQTSLLKRVLVSRLSRRVFLEKKLSEQLSFVGVVQDVPALMAQSDILIAPFTVAHFARPLIEAGMMGLPVVASRLGSFSEVVLDGQTGYLVELGDYSAWVKKIELLLDNHQLRSSIGTQAYDYCKDRFSCASYKQKIEAVYRSLSKGHY